VPSDRVPYTKLLGMILLLASLTALFALLFGTVTFEGEPYALEAPSASS